LLDLMQREQLGADDIASVITRVHQGAIDVLGRVVVPQTVHQAKFSMGTVLGLIALYGKAGLTEFHAHALTDPRVGQFREKVSMMLDAQVDDAYPARWLGRVEVNTRDGRTLHGAIDEPKGDPGNTLSRAELEDKFRRLVQFSGARSADEAGALIDKVWRLRKLDSLAELA
ncbi:MAG TPA: 2-methylcitrate dehydratase, partial [Pseudomonas sp.]|nr:2-methylcitrate dehydratase [Pseudomonas sp.]